MAETMAVLVAIGVIGLVYFYVLKPMFLAFSQASSIAEQALDAAEETHETGKALLDLVEYWNVRFDTTLATDDKARRIAVIDFLYSRGWKVGTVREVVKGDATWIGQEYDKAEERIKGERMLTLRHNGTEKKVPAERSL